MSLSDEERRTMVEHELNKAHKTMEQVYVLATILCIVNFFTLPFLNNSICKYPLEIRFLQIILSGYFLSQIFF